ncbi:hypothetical protein [Erysipelothrix anatis]|uniref:hypothetical protein n=1 Tax=Erysipelothrix anatis TaxID=2683713 RepID=UPI00135A5BE8|nr:hypothetical protein [Erysipelothrix anatis]
MITIVKDILIPVGAVTFLIWIQVLLSKGTNPKMGYILPGIITSMSLFWILLVLTLVLPSMSTADRANFQYFDLVKLFLITNIPSLILLGIHLLVVKVRKS